MKTMKTFRGILLALALACGAHAQTSGIGAGGYLQAGNGNELGGLTAKIFMNNRSQAVRIPKEFQFTTSEVFIRRQGDELILSARPADWSAYLASGPVASQEFMEEVEDLPVQERSL